MNPGIAFIAAAIGYFVGAISFTRLMGRFILPGQDVSTAEIPIKGSDKKFQLHSYGATSIRAKAGAKYGCLTSILDMVKITLPTLMFRVLYPDMSYFLVTAAAGVAGHNFPPYYGFKGGRGMSPMYGGLVVIDWLAIPVITIVGTNIGFWMVKYAFLSYFGVTLTLIPWLWFRFHDLPHLAYAVAINAFFWIASIPDLRIYAAYNRTGEFNKVGNRFGRKAGILAGLAPVALRRWRISRGEQVWPGYRGSMQFFCEVGLKSCRSLPITPVDRRVNPVFVSFPRSFLVTPRDGRGEGCLFVYTLEVPVLLNQPAS